MKKWLSLAAAVLVNLLPGLLAQDIEEEAPNPDAPAAPSGVKEAKTKTKVGAKDAKGGLAEVKNSEFSAQQQRIQEQMNKMKKAKRGGERRRVRDALLREQRILEVQVNRKLKPLQDQVAPLKERIRLSGKKYRPQLEKELADLESKIETIKKDADLEKWCAKPDSLVTEAGKAPNPGPGKKARRSKKKK